MPLPWDIYLAEAVTSKLLGMLHLRPTTFTGLPGSLSTAAVVIQPWVTSD